MGWWQNTPDGQQTPGATGMLWGDQIADIMDETLDKIIGIYTEEWQRPPTKAELRAGLEFSLGGLP